MGFAMAQLFNPSTENNVPVLGEFYYIVAILIYLAIGGHGFLFDAIAQSFNVVPLGELAFQDEFFKVFTALTSEIFVIALKIAAPVFVSILIIDLSLGLVARLVPQMNVFIFGFPLKISVGMIIIAFGLPIFGTLFRAIYESSRANIVTMIQLMTP
jgi:flagellar biosynthetic protein FliR